MWQRHAPLALLILLLAPGPAFAQPSGMSPYVVGAICSLTGRDAPVGMAQRDALLLLTEQITAKGGINGHPLRVIVEDDASDSGTAVRAVKKLIEQDYVQALIGPSGTPQGLAIIPIVTSARVPLLSTADGATSPLNPWIFRSPPTLVMEVDRILSYLVAQRIQRVGLLYDAEPYGTSARDVLRMMKPRYDVAMVIVEESFSASDTDMTGQLSRLKTAGSQAVIAWGSNPGLAIIARNAEQLQIPLVMMNSRAAVGTDLLSRTGYATDHILVVAGKLVVADQLPASDVAKKPSQAFARDFWSRFNRQANNYAGYAWDALGILVNAYRKVGADRVKLRDEIEKTYFIGVSGVYTYSPTYHDGPSYDPNLVLVRASQGRWELVKNFWGMGVAAWSPPATDTVAPELGPVTVTPTALTHQGGEVALSLGAADNVGVARVLLTQIKPNGEQNSGIVPQVIGTLWAGVWRTNWRIAPNNTTTAHTYTIKIKVNDAAGNSVEARPIALTVAGRPPGSSPVLGTQPPHGAAAHHSPPPIPQATQGPSTAPGSQVSRAPQSSSVPQIQQRPQVAQPTATVAQGAWLAVRPATAQDAPLAQSLNARLQESSRGWGAAARSVSVEIANGAVRLTGKVPTAQERANIETAVRRTQGVRSVTNAITVGP